MIVCRKPRGVVAGVLAVLVAVAADAGGAMMNDAAGVVFESQGVGLMYELGAEGAAARHPAEAAGLLDIRYIPSAAELLHVPADGLLRSIDGLSLFSTLVDGWNPGITLHRPAVYTFNDAPETDAIVLDESESESES